MADIVRTRLVSRYYTLPASPETLNAELEDLEASLNAEIQGESSTDATVQFRRYVSMHFGRQSTGLEIGLPWDRFTPERVDELADLFVQRYETLYGIGVGHLSAGIELSSIRVDAVGAVTKPDLDRANGSAGHQRNDRKGSRMAYFQDGLVETPVFAFDGLAPGHRLTGPAIVESEFTTVVVPPSGSATLDGFGTLVIQP
jgi:N-methylhydantoinase A/oxoprolinase/acetone carboxylase beta subunit